LEWYVEVLKKYATFDGRARRKEYWMFQLINTIILIGLLILSFTISSSFALIVAIYTIGIFAPSIAVTVRRLHDIDKSGSWILISLVPFIGGIWFFILTCTEGTYGPNSYGTDPIES
jgi:uncharacterized membrane protein YhaH (DUF805 family)